MIARGFGLRLEPFLFVTEGTSWNRASKGMKSCLN